MSVHDSPRLPLPLPWLAQDRTVQMLRCGSRVSQGFTARPRREARPALPQAGLTPTCPPLLPTLQSGRRYGTLSWLVSPHSCHTQKCAHELCRASPCSQLRYQRHVPGPTWLVGSLFHRHPGSQDSCSSQHSHTF